MKQVVRHVGTWMILLSLSLTAPFQISGAVRMRLAAGTETIHERKPVENGDGMRATAPLLIDGADVVETASGQAAASLSQGPEISSPSAILMEASTGQVIYEKNADEPRSPASITKIMTLILIFDALESGKIKMTDQVVTSAYAKSMGGSQVFLEEGEVQTVETLIKCIVVASGNDASVAMAEYIAGDERGGFRRCRERTDSAPVPSGPDRAGAAGGVSGVPFEWGDIRKTSGPDCGQRSGGLLFRLSEKNGFAVRRI